MIKPAKPTESCQEFTISNQHVIHSRVDKHLRAGPSGWQSLNIMAGQADIHSYHIVYLFPTHAYISGYDIGRERDRWVLAAVM